MMYSIPVRGSDLLHYSEHMFYVTQLIIHTYRHNWPLQPSSQDYGLASHTTHVECVNFIREWQNLRFNVDSERQIFEKLFHGRFILLSEFLPEIYWEKNVEVFFCFIFCFDVSAEMRLRTVRLISQHKTNTHGDFCS